MSSEGRNLVNRNLPDKLMVRVKGRGWVRVDVIVWKTRLAKAINRRIARILSNALSRVMPLR